MDFRACFCIFLASLASVLNAAPEFLGGTTPRTAFALESYAIRRRVAHYPVIDLASPTFELAISQVTFTDSSNQFVADVINNVIYVNVSNSLFVGEWAVSIALAGAGTLPVTITVYQTNFPPIFFVDNYHEEIDETAPVGTTVVTVTAVDLAAELGSDPSDGVFVYEFDGERSLYFSIGPDSGVITLAQSVDYDTGDTEFIFNVVAQETESTAMLSARTEVLILVNNINDHTPQFIGTAYHYTIPENSGAGLREADDGTAIITATDGDVGTFGDITYTLTGGGTLFDIEVTSAGAQLRTLQDLNREGTPSYTMTLEATDTGGLSDSVTIGVTVEDENDNLPVITNNPVTADEPVLECQLDKRLLSTVTAVDTADSGALAEVAYVVVGGDTNHISLNEETGELALGVAPIDYEDPLERTFSLSVKAIDNPNGPVTSQHQSLETFIQTITIGDCNDNPPVFSSTTYEYTVTENMNNLVGPTISTTDADATVENQAVTYQITDPDPGNWFDIAADGTLSIRPGKVVDREHTGVLTDSLGNGVVSFTIEAVNAAITATLTSVQDAQVVVTISDQNDNAPTMDENPLTGTTSIVVLEDALVGTILAVVRASDPDVGDNAVIMYEISSGNDLGKFSLDEANGVLTLAEPIDFEMEARLYTVTVTAINPPPAPTPPDSSDDDIVLTIMIEGANEHAPEFGSDRYDVDISEYNVLASAQQHAAGETIATVTATDADANDEIEYIITGGNEDDLFEIPNPLFGNIALKDPTLIDFETTTSYALVITATDLVIPESDRRTTTTYLYITVIDENDNLPVISSDMYTGHVDEEAPIGTSIILTIPISVTDADSLYGMETTEFEINTVGSPLPSPFLAFTLSEDGTSLTTTTAIDREEDGDVFTFQMRVADAAGNEDTAMMTVDILDVNDNPPMIQEPQGGFLIMVAENNPVNSDLVTITAEDMDLGANAEVFFTLQGGAGYFDIGHDTGVVTQIGSLQALEPPVTFTLTVIARDSGGLSSSRDLIVNLTYSNDHAPVFESRVYSGSVAECADDGTPISPVLTLRATDGDTDSVVSYYIETSSVGDLFQLENIGQTTTIRNAGSSVFDRESEDTYTFTVYATDGIIGTDDDSATVTIFISDCNDHNPIFTQDLYEVDVPEGTASGATVIQVHTNDADIGENEEVRFNVESVNPSSFSNVFHVDPLTGGIVASVNIDNTYTGSSACSTLGDHSNNVTLTIKATDQATMQDQLSDYTTVFVRLLDRNSEAPSFVPSSFYSFEISENADGVDLGTVEAVDECDMDSDVTYFLVSGQDSAPFEIDQDTGVIRVISGLDREVNDFLVVQLQAVDDGTNPGPQTGYASVTINVLDENDNAPKLVRDTFDISLPENIPVGSTLISIVASDPDLDENRTISFTMQSGDSDLFMLEGSPAGSDSDHLVTRVSLDRERVSVHTVTVLVSDAGSPRKNSTAVMTLTLTDVNDNEPVWTAGHGSEFEIFENVTDGLVVDLNATDRDDGLNQELVYYFVGGSQDFESFHIDRSDGTLHIARDLDYETTQEYTLTIVVSDRRAETDDDGVTPLTNSTTIHIIVKDVNDNEPYFNRCPHDYEIPETFRVGAVVGNNIQDSVEDDDSLAIRTPFYYYIDSPENVECFGPFCIDVDTGEITLESNIDFETTPTYTFYVVVSDMPNLSPEEVYIPPRIDLCDKVGTEENNITRVDVVLTDVNDQEPVFDPNSLLAAVAEEAEFDTTVTVLKAIDKDENDTFSTVYYEIIAVDPPYLVNRETGEVTTADTFTGRSGETDKFTVVAYDNRGSEPSFTSTAILTVRVFKECEQIVAVADQTREVAEACRTQLETAISNQTGYIIYITKIRVHQDKEQNIVDTTKADMIFYALHLATGDLVPPPEVIAIIERGLDLQEDPIKSLQDNCQISTFKQFCSESAEASTITEVSTAIGVAMGILAVIILSLLICLLFVCALERRKARKLRVRKKTHLDQSSNFSQFSQLGTSNPIWVPPYENWEQESTTTANQSAVDRDNPLYESQELTIEMFKDADEDDMLSLASSRGNLSKVKPPRSSTPGGRDSVYDDYDPLADALGISGKPEDSQTSLI